MFGLFRCQTLGIRTGQFITPGCFINIGWMHLIGNQPDLAQERKPAGRSRGKDKLRARIAPCGDGFCGDDRQGRLT